MSWHEDGIYDAVETLLRKPGALQNGEILDD
jgi:hypothetical protein